jgi:stalled ribosome rescue protein Dom34
MSIRMGLWIDHRQAVIVRLFDYGEDIVCIASELPKRVRFSGTSYSRDENDPQNDFAEDKRDKRFNALLNHYYDKVIASLGNAESILIIGPGEAKIELEKRLMRDELASHHIVVEAADKMTEKQISAKVRQHFQEIEARSTVR